MTTLKRYAWYALFIIMTLTMSLTTVMAQEEAAASGSNDNFGVIVIILIAGSLTIMGIGAAMNTQAKDDAEASE